MITRKFSRNLLQTYDLNVSSKIFKFSESCDKQTNAYTFQEASYHEFLPYLQAWSRLAKPIHSPSGQTNARIRGNDLKTSKLLLSSTDPFRSFNFSRSSFFSHLLFFFLSLFLLSSKRRISSSYPFHRYSTRVLNVETRKASRHSSFVFHLLFPRHWTLHVYPPFLLFSYLRLLFRFDRVSTTFLLCFFFGFLQTDTRFILDQLVLCVSARFSFFFFLQFWFLISFLYLCCLLTFFRLWI